MLDANLENKLRADLMRILDAHRARPCDCCGKTLFWDLPSRGGSRKCCNCGCVRAFTFGTVLSRTRIPLRHWKDLIERLSNGEPVPTSRTVARWYGIAPSSGWHMLQRVFVLFVLNALGSVEIVSLLLARRRAMREMVQTAPAAIRELDVEPEDPRTEPDPVPVSLLLGDNGVGVEVGVVQPRTFGPLTDEIRALARWVQARLTGRRKVSLRWMSRWVAVWCAVWLFHRRRRPVPSILDLGSGAPIPVYLVLGGRTRHPWTALLRRVGRHLPLRLLDPWVTAMGASAA